MKQFVSLVIFIAVGTTPSGCIGPQKELRKEDRLLIDTSDFAPLGQDVDGNDWK